VTHKRNKAIKLAKPSPEISSLKMDLYRHFRAILAEYLRSGNWLAAIVIEESIISDRIESVMAKLNVDLNINSLGENIDNFRKHANRSDPKYFEILKSLESWSRERNYAIHMLVKTHDGENLNWEERIDRVRIAALDGEKLVTELNNWARRKVNRHPANKP